MYPDATVNDSFRHPYQRCCMDEYEKNKPLFTDFKRVVWHESFLATLDKITEYSKTGYAYHCADHICRLLFPFILILSADYEEQYVSILYLICIA